MISVLLSVCSGHNPHCVAEAPEPALLGLFGFALVLLLLSIRGRGGPPAPPVPVGDPK